MDDHITKLITYLPVPAKVYLSSASPTMHLNFLLDLDPRALSLVEEKVGKKARNEIVHIGLKVHSSILSLHTALSLPTGAESPGAVATFKSFALDSTFLLLLLLAFLLLLKNLLFFLFGRVLSTLLTLLTTLTTTLFITALSPLLLHVAPGYIALATLTTLPPPHPLINHYLSIPARNLGPIPAPTKKALRTLLLTYFVLLRATLFLSPLLRLFLPFYDIVLPLVAFGLYQPSLAGVKMVVRLVQKQVRGAGADRILTSLDVLANSGDIPSLITLVKMRPNTSADDFTAISGEDAVPVKYVKLTFEGKEDKYYVVTSEKASKRAKTGVDGIEVTGDVTLRVPVVANMDAVLTVTAWQRRTFGEDLERDSGRIALRDIFGEDDIGNKRSGLSVGKGVVVDVEVEETGGYY